MVDEHRAEDRRVLSALRTGLVKERVLVVCPSRNRPRELAELYRSLLDTSDRADLAVWIDQDQREFYGWLGGQLPQKHRLRVRHGARIGPVAAANTLCLETAGDNYVAYGFLCDDCRLTSSGWDRRLMDGLPESPVLVAPEHGIGEIDFPFVSRAWLRTFGWYAPPSFYHWGWPSALAALALATGRLIRPPAGEFVVEHRGEHGHSQNRDRYPADIVNLYAYFARHFEGDLQRLRDQIHGGAHAREIQTAAGNDGDRLGARASR